MSIVTGIRALIQQDMIKANAPTSEDFALKVAQLNNFHALYQYSEKQFFANGKYGIMSSYPQTAVDGIVFMPFNAEIIKVISYNMVAGTSGTTELDIKKATTSGGAFTSIFSTTPKFTSAAASNVWTDDGVVIGSQTGVTKPALVSVNLNANDALRFDIKTAMPDAQNCGILIMYRPR